MRKGWFLSQPFGGWGLVVVFPEAFFFYFVALGHHAVFYVFYHAGVAAGVHYGVFGGEVELGGVLFDDGVDAAGFAFPGGVGGLVGAADGGDELYHSGMVGGEFFEFGVVSEFVNVAGAHEDEEAVSAASVGEVLADDAYVGYDAGYGGDEELVGQ